ncbi:MAG: GreA/GreB family elongation factor [Acidobacteriota bacterium]|nr:GreA/GreB family elongation factor [Acidobacteriota bacterium]
MTIPRTLRKYIEAGRLDEVESAWLGHLETDLDDIQFFVAGARALKGAGESELAAMLLELLDEELRAAEAREHRLTLLREVGLLMLEPAELHRRILEILRAIYRGLPSLEGFLEQVGLHRAVEDIPKTWLKVAALRAVMQFEKGSIVWMKGKGAGRVTEVNFELESFRIDFERSPGLRVGFGGAAKLLRALPSTHVLRRKIEDPQSLIALKASDPGELLLLTLRSYDEPRSASEIRDSLAGVVDAAEWSSFWSAARKNPQVVTEGQGARQRYRALASMEDAEEAVLAAFDAAEPGLKLEIYRRNADRSDDLRAHLAERLVALAEASPKEELELRFAVATALRDAPELPPDAPWLPAAEISEAPDAAALLATLDDRTLRESALALVRERRPDWVDVYERRLEREEDPRLLSAVADALTAAAPERLTAFYDRVLGQPRKFPAAFAWMAERAQGDPVLLDRKPLRFAQALLATTQPRELEPYRGRLRKVLEDGGPIAQLLQRIAPDQAALAEETLRRSNLEEYLLAPLIGALHVRFPERREARETPLYATEESIAARLAELKELREVEIPANRRAIAEARELGDLRENFEYKAARQRHEYLAARQAVLQRDLHRAQPMDLSRQDADEVRVASRVTVRSGGAGTRTLLILGPWESDPDRDVVSYDSDLAQRLLGLPVGATVDFADSTLEIVAIEPWQGG